MGGLILYDSARDALAECKSVDEVKGWSDRAAAAQAYARMAKDKTLEVDAAEIRIRAERRLGEMLAEQKAAHGLNSGGRPKTGTLKEPVSDSRNRPPTLEEVGIDKKLSARAQKIAAVPEAKFEAEVADWRERVEAEGERVTARLESLGAKEAPGADDRLDAIARDFEAMQRIVEADDQLAAAWAEVQLAQQRYEQLDKLYSAKCRELDEMTKEAKRWKRKAEAK